MDVERSQMKVTRYVSNTEIKSIQEDNFGNILFTREFRMGTPNEITRELPDPPLEIEGYWCDRLPAGRKVCDGGNACLYPESEDSCSPVSLVEKPK